MRYVHTFRVQTPLTVCRDELKHQTSQLTSGCDQQYCEPDEQAGALILISAMNHVSVLRGMIVKKCK